MPSDHPDWWTSDEWATPRDLVSQLEYEFGTFQLDPCTRPAMAKAPAFYTREDDGLQQPWAPLRVFCNPPYSDPTPWVMKAKQEADMGALVIMLLPVSTDTAWFHDVLLRYAEIRFLRGRVRFIGWQGTPMARPKTPNLLAIFRPKIPVLPG